MENKSAMVKFRIEKSKKETWVQLCLKRKISLSQLVIDSVEGRLLDDERRRIIRFIEKQDNIFVKIETNINQIARVVNSQKFISEKELQNFSDKITEIKKLKQEQNMIFVKIYSLLAKV